MSVRRVTMNGVARLGVGIAAGRAPSRRCRRSARRSSAPRQASRPACSCRGDAGVGKSRLVAEAVERAATRGLTRCSPGAASTPSALAALPAVHRDRRPARGDAGPSCSRAHPELAPAAARRHVAGRAPEDRELGQLPLFSAVLWVFAQLAAEGAGAARARGPALGRPLHPRPAGVPQPNAAPGGPGRRRELPQRRPAPAPGTRSGRCSPSWPGCQASSGIDLPPLGDVDMAQLLSQRGRGGGARAHPAHVARTGHEGNAFFAEELLAAAEDCATDVPGELADVLLGRVEQLAPAAQTGPSAWPASPGAGSTTRCARRRHRPQRRGVARRGAA